MAEKFNKAFWRWFGDSKVVDSKGNPLVVYHASRTDFEVFDVDRCELGCHFGTKAQANSVHQTHTGTGIRAFYLSLKNPVRMNDHTEWHPQTIAEELMEMGAIKQSSQIFSAKRVRKIFHDLGYDGIVYLNRHEGLTESDLDIIDRVGIDIDGHSSDKEIREFLPWLRDSWIAFKPTQIKAVDNGGSWDADDPDIRSNPRRKR